MSEGGPSPAAAPASNGFEPEAWGKYFLIDRVAVGGMAEIFKAKTFGEGGFENLFIIKRILAHMSENEQFIQMFLDEAKITALLQHANIVRIWDFGKIQSNYFLAMDAVEGKDVKQILRKMYALGKTLHIQFAVYIAMEAAKGLDHAHKRTNLQGQPLHIVHRDISPSNILVGYHGEVKVADFGIVKASVVSENTSSGTLKGKFEYMSPEQATGLDVDRRSDIFSLGVVLWEMLTGRRAFKSESELRTLERVKAVDLDPPSAVNPNVPARLDAIVKQALERDPNDRYQDARELHADLLDFLYPASPDFVQQSLSHFMQTVFTEEMAEERRRQEENTRIALALHQAAQNVDIEADWQEQPSGTRAPVSAPSPAAAPSRLPIMIAASAIGIAVVAAAGAIWWATHAPTEPQVVVQEVQAPGATTGAVQVRIGPVAGRVRVDGVDHGAGTDVSIADLAPDVPHEFRVEADGYQPYTDTLTLTAGETMRMPVTLVAVGKPAAPRAEPKASEPARPGAPKEAAPQEPVATPTPPPAPRPEPTPKAEPAVVADGKLSVNVSGGWADVYIDGKKVGQTPLFGRTLPAGSHTIRARNDAIGLDEVRTVTIKSGETTSISFAP